MLIGRRGGPKQTDLKAAKGFDNPAMGSWRKSRMSNAGAVRVDAALQVKLSRTVRRSQSNWVGLRRTSILFRQNDEIVDVTEASQDQNAWSVIRGHKREENAFSRIGGEGPTLFVALVGQSGQRDPNEGQPTIRTSRRRNLHIGIKGARKSKTESHYWPVNGIPRRFAHFSTRSMATDA